MTGEIRQEILQSLVKLSELTPDVRFGQLVTNLAYLAAGATAGAVWDLEDADLLDAIRRHTAELSDRRQGVA